MSRDLAEEVEEEGFTHVDVRREVPACSVHRIDRDTVFAVIGFHAQFRSLNLLQTFLRAFQAAALSVRPACCADGEEYRRRQKALWHRIPASRQACTHPKSHSCNDRNHPSTGCLSTPFTFKNRMPTSMDSIARV
eukprot:752242-Hanusia_phi.AAC.1